MNVKIIKLQFTELHMSPRDIPKLRGFFATQYQEFPEFHNHLPGGKFTYRFPVIQYRIINSHPALIGVNEGFELIKKILFETDKLVINNRQYLLREKVVSVDDAELGETESPCTYLFHSPWMALNEENFHKYIELNSLKRQQLLKDILRGNLKTLAKGFGYWIENFDAIQVEGYFKPLQVNFKNQKMLCFTGEFTTNFQIPNWLGLGKQSARGFGVVKRV